MRSKLFAAVVLVAAVVVIALLAFFNQAAVVVPADAASATIVRATPEGQECLARITKESGWLDLCWDAWQEEDGDSAKDYFTLRVYGTASGAGSGIRWWRVRTNLDAHAAPVQDEVFDGWPSARYDDQCNEQQVPSMFVVEPSSQMVCGQTTGDYVGVWGYQVTWTCGACIFADKSERPVIMYFAVDVPQGQSPAFEIGADFGS